MNWFYKAAKYLFIYTGTLSEAEWQQVIEKVYKEQELKLGAKGAMEQTIAMVAYYCMEIGSTYKGNQAKSKFRTVNLWPDFLSADNWWKDEWAKKKKTEEEVLKVREELSKLPSFDPNNIINHYISREAISLLSKLIVDKHGQTQLDNMRNEIDIFVSIYSGTAVLSLFNTETGRLRVQVPSLVSTYFLEQELINRYSLDELRSMKKYDTQS